jgi:hypothetical protein
LSCGKERIVFLFSLYRQLSDKSRGFLTGNTRLDQ